MAGKVRTIALVGSPNVGKSMIFHHLTGAYVVVSNYPGTTVDITRGRADIGGRHCEVLDTPGIYSLNPVTGEERVTLELLCREQPDIIIHVADAKNLSRMLPITLELLDGGLPVILVLNIMDEAERLGIRINTGRLADMLGIPVIPSSAAENRGMDLLRRQILSYKHRPPQHLSLSSDVEEAVGALMAELPSGVALSPRLTALLLLQGGVPPGIDESYRAAARRIITTYMNIHGRPLAQTIARDRQNNVAALLAQSVRAGRQQDGSRMAALDRLTCHPLWGLPILGLVLYFGLYQFVGRFGGGWLVDFLNHGLFGLILNPLVADAAARYLPWEWGQTLLAGEYGLFSLGVRYAAAIVLPIVGTFFLAFAVLEDSGYLPRLAMLADRLFRQIGLNGRAVIPMTLGLGCGTMAVMVTRTLETRRERIVATFLLALAVPCSAQLGLVLSLLAHNQNALAVWLICLLAVLLVAGKLTAILLGCRGSPFYMELPPLRMPLAANVLQKAGYRMVWYTAEVLPVFLGTSLLLWAGDRSGLLALIIDGTEPFMGHHGLPPATAAILLLGFFRRDYGAAGLYDLAADGSLSDQQLLVASVILTLFLPCVAQLAVMVKERGPWTAAAMSAVIAAVALTAGWLVNKVVSALCLL